MTETQYVGVPPGLIDAVMHLVSTGPVPLGGYSLAEMVAVDAVVDFLDEMPSEEEVGEAVRSLLREIDDALRRLRERLPDGDPERESTDPNQVLEVAGQTALVTVTDYTASGSTEIAQQSADIVLADQNGKLHVFTRDPEDPARLVSQGLDRNEVIELIRELAAPEVLSAEASQATADTSATGRIAKIRSTIMRRLRRGSDASAG
jgi:hypothetical protein